MNVSGCFYASLATRTISLACLPPSFVSIFDNQPFSPSLLLVSASISTLDFNYSFVKPQIFFVRSLFLSWRHFFQVSSSWWSINSFTFKIKSNLFLVSVVCYSMSILASQFLDILFKQITRYLISTLIEELIDPILYKCLLLEFRIGFYIY